MSNGLEGIGIIIVWLGTIAISIGTGIYTYHWIQPESFWGVILFLIVWGIVSKIAYAVLGLIVAGLATMFDR